MTEAPIEQLLDLVDSLVVAEMPPGDDVVPQVRSLVDAGMADASIDRELRADATVRWLMGAVVGARHVRVARPGLDTDEDLAQLRMILTRWLHPARPDA